MQYNYSFADETGLEFLPHINQFAQAIATNNSGDTAPTDIFPYMDWVDTSNPTTYYWKKANHTADDWATIASYDVSTKSWEIIAPATFQLKAPNYTGIMATIASATTTNIGAATADYLNVTGTTTITAFDNVIAGLMRTLVFDGALTLTHNADSLILPTGANITTVAGDTAIFRSEGSGNWRLVGGTIYTRVVSASTTSAVTGVRQTVLDGLKDANGYPACIAKHYTTSDISNSASGLANGIAEYLYNGNANDALGTYNGSATNVTYPTDADLGQCASFNGSSSYISATYPTGKLTGALTIVGQIKTSAAVGTLVSTCPAQYANAIKIIINSGKLTVRRGTSAGAGGAYILTATSTASVNTGAKVRFAIRLTTTTWEIWINGALDSSGTYSGTPVDGSQFLIGKDIDHVGTSFNYYNGLLNNLRFFQRALDDVELANLTNELSTAYDLIATIKASATDPFIVTAADGYSDKGAVDYVGAFLSDQNVTLTANATNYLYAEYNKIAGTWSLGATTTAPTYAKSETPTFNIAKMKMTIGNPRIYFAEAVAGASSITGVTPYAYRGEYDSGDFTTTAVSTSKNHNIGVADVAAQLKEAGSQKAKDIALTNKTATWTGFAGTSNIKVWRTW